MRRFLLLACLLLVASPAGAQDRECAQDGIVQPCPPHGRAWSGTVYYSPVVDHQLHLWEHGISFALERQFGEYYSIGPRLTLLHRANGQWYGDSQLYGIHFSRHFHAKPWLMPHVHLEAGLAHEIYIPGRECRAVPSAIACPKSKDQSAYVGLGGSIGWRLGNHLTIQIPQWTHLWMPSNGKHLEAASVGISVHF